MTISRTAVVTGASSGIGASTARLLRQRGWKVFAVARRSDRIQTLADETGAIPLVCDITDQHQVDALAAAVAAAGGADALVNNAGGAIGVDLVEDGHVDDWKRMYEVNVLGTLRVTKALLPILRAGVARTGVADILTVTSTAGLTAYEGGGGYTAAKHAEQDMVETLRLELNGEPIRVMAVAPGLVQTPEFSLNRLHGNASAAEAVYSGVPEPLTEDDIALVIANSLELPAHVNIDLQIVRPVAQAAQFKLFHGNLEVKGQK